MIFVSDLSTFSYIVPDSVNNSLPICKKLSSVTHCGFRNDHLFGVIHQFSNRMGRCIRQLKDKKVGYKHLAEYATISHLTSSNVAASRNL